MAGRDCRGTAMEGYEREGGRFTSTQAHHTGAHMQPSHLKATDVFLATSRTVGDLKTELNSK